MLGNHTIHLSIQIVPKKKDADIYPIIDKAIEVIQASGLKYMITPMETVMEGPFDQVNQIALKAQQAVIDAGAEEVLVFIKMHYRKEGDVTFEEKKLDR
ncbi:MAG: MTH1187 family thiamine-binding protein [Bacteroidota bacterium]